jgi:hypothetical protein
VDAEADAVDQEDFRRFLERTSPAELIRHLGKAIAEEGGGEAAESDLAEAEAAAAEASSPGPDAPPAAGPGQEATGEPEPGSPWPEGGAAGEPPEGPNAGA